MRAKKIYEILKAFDNLKGTEEDKKIVRDFLEKALDEYCYEDEEEEDDGEDGEEKSSGKTIIKEYHYHHYYKDWTNPNPWSPWGTYVTASSTKLPEYTTINATSTGETTLMVNPLKNTTTANINNIK